jgi:hypothetical protein
MSKPKAKKEYIELPDVMAAELVRIVNTAHEDGKLISGFVCLLEMYDGKKKTMKIVTNQDMPEYQTFGLINYAQQKFEYSLAPDDDDWDDEDYNPNWYEGQ